MATTFDTIDPLLLDQGDTAFLDDLPFGVIGFSASTVVDVYNATESAQAGIRPDTVLGKPFFLAVAVCMNNFMVAQRFEDEPRLDVVIDYVLTFRMRPTPVRIRLIKRPDLSRQYLLIERRQK